MNIIQLLIIKIRSYNYFTVLTVLLVHSVYAQTLRRQNCVGITNEAILQRRNSCEL